MKVFRNNYYVLVAGLLSALFLGCSEGSSLPQVIIHTAQGDIVVEVDTVKSEVSAKNFLALVKRGVYDSSLIYRVVRPDNQPNSKYKIEVIQGGLFADSLVDRETQIRHETTKETGICHTDGTISMARSTPGTASTEFFICIGNQPELDFGGRRNPDGQGFSAFGHVVEGMDIVRKIQQMKDTSQYLVAPVAIVSVRENRK